MISRSRKIRKTSRSRKSFGNQGRPQFYPRYISIPTRGPTRYIKFLTPINGVNGSAYNNYIDIAYNLGQNADFTNMAGGYKKVLVRGLWLEVIPSTLEMNEPSQEVYVGYNTTLAPPGGSQAVYQQLYSMVVPLTGGNIKRMWIPIRPVSGTTGNIQVTSYTSLEGGTGFLGSIQIYNPFTAWTTGTTICQIGLKVVCMFSEEA